MNEFVKKTQKTPKEEIQIAKDRKKDFIERMITFDDMLSKQFQDEE